MILTTLDISHFRIIQHLAIQPHASLNLITGDNGSGKSSVLESIQCLATGHSFRTRKPKELISRDQDAYRLTAVFTEGQTGREHRAGLERTRNGDIALRLDFEPVHSQSQITKLLPVKTLTPDSHQLIQEGPEYRRQFLDWGLFHVEPNYLHQWRDFKRSLAQRNLLLRSQAPDSEIDTWNTPFAQSAQAINNHRNNYVAKLADALGKRMTQMDLKFHVELRYRPGWDTEVELDDLLKINIQHHRRMKTTTDGPHRADIVVNAGGSVAKQTLSRGEQKVLVYVLHLSQLDLLREMTGSKAIVLCDDLTSELDDKHSLALINQLMHLESQIFVSGVDLSVLAGHAHQRFHMEHGIIESDYNQSLIT